MPSDIVKDISGMKTQLDTLMFLVTELESNKSQSELLISALRTENSKLRKLNLGLTERLKEMNCWIDDLERIRNDDEKTMLSLCKIRDAPIDGDNKDNESE